MPQISTISLHLEPSIPRNIDREIVQDDVPLVSNLFEAVELLRRCKRGNTFYFRVEDDPGVMVAWQSVGSAAIIHTLRKRRLVQIDIILLGSPDDDLAAVERARSEAVLTETDSKRIQAAARPTIVRLSGTDDGIVGLLSLILFIPMMWELHGVE